MGLKPAIDNGAGASAASLHNSPVRWLGKIVAVRAPEWRALWMSFACHFLVLASYYIIRPIRDDMGVAGGVNNLPWLFTGTLVAMLIANALFSALVARYSRQRFIPIAYRFFLLNLVVFFILLKTLSQGQQIWVGRSFYIWTSVFNLFVVSVFWAFLTDVFHTEQAKRLFGFISLGGTLGAIVGAAVTASLVQRFGAVHLLLVSATLLEIAAQCVRRFPAEQPAADTQEKLAAERPVGGTVWSGIVHDFRSPYLLGIGGYMLLYSITSTILYFQQADLAAHHFTDRAARTAFFAQLDLLVNVLTVFVQIFLTGNLLRWLGVGFTLALMPALSVVGFTTMGFLPTLTLFVIFQTLRRAANFGLARPAREVLFTVLSREDKYKAKSFLDTFVYRTGDQIGAWTYPVVGWLGLGLAGASFVAAPLAALWCLLSLWLGRRQLALTSGRDTTGLGA